MLKFWLIRASTWLLALFGVFLSLAMLLLNFNPMGLAFQTSIVVSNESGEGIHFTPMGISEGSGSLRPLPRFLFSAPLLLAVKQSDFYLPPGQETTVNYDWDDIIFTTLLVRDEKGFNREVLVDPKARVEDCCYMPRSPRVVVAQLVNLPAARPEAVTSAAEYSINPRVLFLYLPFLGPLAIVAAWFISRHYVSHVQV